MALVKEPECVLAKNAGVSFRSWSGFGDDTWWVLWKRFAPTFGYEEKAESVLLIFVRGRQYAFGTFQKIIYFVMPGGVGLKSRLPIV